MKLTDLLKDIELGKVYTDKDKPPFKVNEGKSDQSFKKIMDLLKKESRRLNDDDSYELSVKLKKWFNKNIYEGINEEKIDEQEYSSSEAKIIVDKSLKDYATILRKAQHKLIKDWMTKAKSGVIDYFDLVKGFQSGDMSRAHPYETKFLMSVLSKDKIMDRFRKYFGGRKGKKR